MVRAGNTLAFDTEFLREKTYHPLLCLAQLNIDGKILIIDPLQALDYSELWQALLDAELTLHAGRQDLEVLAGVADGLPRRLFDTQIAAGLIGLPPQVGYASLVDEVCHVRLDKAHTRTDWSRRPLAQAVLQYAADDVVYLTRVREHLSSELDRLDRLHWLHEDCASLLDPEHFTVDTKGAWRRVKGLGRLPGEVQQRGRALASWREAMADRRNLPRQWLLRDEALIAIAFEAPDDIDTLAGINGVPRKLIDRRGKDILAVLAGELDAVPAPRSRPDEAEKKLVKLLSTIVREAALSLAIEPEVLAPQKALRRIAAGDLQVRALTGWRDTVIGEAIRAQLP
ncbi:MAG: HRDC domain-containing protein [Pseudomonadota bacterium]